jgi:hypothetical protein
VKRLGSRTSPRIEKAGRLGLEIAESRLSPRAGFSAGKVGVVKRSWPSVMSPTIDLGTQKASARWSAQGISLDGVGMVVAVVTTIGQDILRASGEMVNLFGE